MGGFLFAGERLDVLRVEAPNEVRDNARGVGIEPCDVQPQCVVRRNDAVVRRRHAGDDEARSGVYRAPVVVHPDEDGTAVRPRLVIGEDDDGVGFDRAIQRPSDRRADVGSASPERFYGGYRLAEAHRRVQNQRPAPARIFVHLVVEHNCMAVRLGLEKGVQHNAACVDRTETGQRRDGATRHRPGYVKRRDNALICRRDGRKRQLERRIERFDDGGDRRPGRCAGDAAPADIGRPGYRNGQRVQAGCTHAVRVGQAADHLADGIGERLQHADPGERRQIAHQCRHRHIDEQRRPHVAVRQEVRRNRLTRQAIVDDQADRFLNVGRRKPLEALIRPQLAQRRVGVRVGSDSRPAVDNPMEDVVPVAFIAHMRIAQRTPQRPRSPILVLDRLVGEVSGSERREPVRYGALQRSPPPAQRCCEFEERHQVRSRPCDQRQLLRRIRFDVGVADGQRQRQNQQRRIVRRSAPGSTDGDRSINDVAPVAANHSRQPLQRVRRHLPTACIVRVVERPQDQDAVEMVARSDRRYDSFGAVVDVPVSKRT